MKKILLKTILSLVVLLFALILTFKIPVVQEWSAHKIAEWISKDLGAPINIGKIRFNSVNDITLEKAHLKDPNGHELIYADSININLRLFPIISKKLIIQTISINNGKIDLKYLEDLKSFNLQFLINYVSPKQPSSGLIKIVEIKKLNLNNIELNFINKIDNKTLSIVRTKNIDYNNINLTKLNLLARDIRINSLENDIRAKIDSLSFKEKSGFILNLLKANLYYSNNKLEFSNMRLVTPNSYIENYVSFSYNTIDDFKDFLNKIVLKVNFINSNVSFKDIAFFAFPINGNILTLKNINGLVEGPISNLKSNRLIAKAHDAIFDSAIILKGIPDIENSLVNLKVNRLNVSKRDIQNILLDISKNIHPDLPDELDNFHVASLSGMVTGKLLNFRTQGTITSKPGDVNIDINTNIFVNEASFTYKGKIESKKINVGTIFNIPKLRYANFSAIIDGRDISPNYAYLNAKTHIKNIKFNNYVYNNITLHGIYNEGITQIKANILDPNIDLKSDIYIYNTIKDIRFNADISNANIKKLNLDVDEDIYVSANIKSHLKYFNLDINNLYGDININKLYIDNTPQLDYDGQVIDNIDISLFYNNDKTQGIKLTSPILDFNINGIYKLSNIYSDVSKAYKQHIYPNEDINIKNIDFNFYAKIKDLTYLTEVFAPNLSIAQNTEIKGQINSTNRLFNLGIETNQIKYKNNSISDLNIIQTSSEGKFNLKLNSKSIHINNIAMTDWSTIIDIENYQANVTVDLINKEHNDKIHLNPLIRFIDTGFELKFIESEIEAEGQKWSFNKASSILKNTNNLIFNNIVLISNEQKILINGIASKNVNDTLNIEVKNVDINKLSILSNLFNINIKGTINGKASIASALAKPIVNSNFIIKNLNYNNIDLGEGTFASSWDPLENSINISGFVDKNNRTIAHLVGKVWPNDKSSVIYATLKMANSPAYTLTTIIPDEVSNVTGNMTGDIIIQGKVSQPNITGYINFDNVKFKINALNTVYTINETIDLNEGSIIFNDKKLIDENGNQANINGSIALKRDITNPNINLSISLNNFIIISPDIKQNYNFYGTVIATGAIKLTGSVKDLFIEGHIEPNEKSSLTILVPNTNKSSRNLITFASFYKTNNQQYSSKESIKKGNKITIKMLANMNDHAEVILALDPLTGEFIKVRGKGSVTINYDTSSEELRLYGLYIVNSGIYNFTSGILSKIFNLAPKSTVSFAGEANNTIINIKAIYTLYTPLDNLYKEVKISSDNTINNNRSVKVNTVIHIHGKIKDLESDFSIDFPNDSQLSLDIFSAYLSNKDNITKQAISLIMTGNFIAGNLNTNTINQFITDALYSTGADILFQQIKNFINTIITIDNIRFNAKITSYSQEIGSNISLWDNRLIVTGNIIAGSRPSSENKDESLKRNSNGITGNIEVEYLVNKSGTIRLKLFNRSNDYLTSLFFNETLYSQGIDVSYTRDFNSILDLFKNRK